VLPGLDEREDGAVAERAFMPVFHCKSQCLGRDVGLSEYAEERTSALATSWGCALVSCERKSVMTVGVSSRDRRRSGMVS
jgi:hypothetical protein